jgi:hypothetical protein
MLTGIQSLRERVAPLASEGLAMLASFALLGAWLMFWFGE